MGNGQWAMGNRQWAIGNAYPPLAGWREAPGVDSETAIGNACPPLAGVARSAGGGQPPSKSFNF